MDLIMVADAREQVRLAGEMMAPSVSLTSVDWGLEVAVVVDMGEQRTGGYGVSVLSVRVAGPDRVELELDVRRPGPGMYVTQAFTHPYALVRLPRVGLRSGPVTLVAFDQGRAEVARRVVAL